MIELFGKHTTRSPVSSSSGTTSSDAEDHYRSGLRYNATKKGPYLTPLSIIRQSSLTTHDMHSLFQTYSVDVSNAIKQLLPSTAMVNYIMACEIDESEVGQVVLSYQESIVSVMEKELSSEIDTLECQSPKMEKIHYGKVLQICYRKLLKQVLRSDGYLKIPSFFENSSKAHIDQYFEYFTKDFHQKQDKGCWKPILSEYIEQRIGRFQVSFGDDLLSQLVTERSVLKSKVLVDLKMSIALQDLLPSSLLQLDWLGSYPVTQTEESVTAIPLYNHEYGRFVDSLRRDETDFTPLQILATGKYPSTIKIYEESHLYSHEHWKERIRTCKQFSDSLVVIEPYSILLIGGGLLLTQVMNPVSAENDHEESFLLRCFAYPSDYDDEDDLSVNINSKSEEIDNDCNAALDSNELDDLREEIGDELLNNLTKGLSGKIESATSDSESEDRGMLSFSSEDSEYDKICNSYSSSPNEDALNHSPR